MALSISSSEVILFPFESVTSKTIVTPPIGTLDVNCSLSDSLIDSCVMPLSFNKIPTLVLGDIYCDGSTFFTISDLVWTSNFVKASANSDNDFDSPAILWTSSVLFPNVTPPRYSESSEKIFLERLESLILLIISSNTALFESTAVSAMLYTTLWSDFIAPRIIPLAASMLIDAQATFPNLSSINAKNGPPEYLSLTLSLSAIT